MNPTYSCTQGELYTVARAAWQSCDTRLASFTALKAKYTALYTAGKMNDITAAETLLDEEQRKAAISLLREQLSVKAAACRDKWQILKLYIEEAYPENEIPIQLQAAGGAHYEKASRENWPSVKQLMLDGETFITANTAALSAGNNMPAAFPLAFATLRGEYDALYSSFVNTTLDGEVQTGNKIIANNAVHQDLMSMLKDGQRIFVDDENVKPLFVFEQILNDIKTSQAGVKGLVKDAATSEPIEGVTVTIDGTDKEDITNEEGRYHITQVAAETYNLTFTKTGYQTKQVNDVEIQPGVTKVLDVLMNV